MPDPDVGQAALDRASDEQNLLLVYQPIHEARSRRIYSAEALLRQQRQTGEIREASIITETAEEGFEMFALDSWALRTAFRDAAHWQSHGAPDVRINVNLSPREFQEGSVHERLKNLVVGFGIDTHKIHLEITETAYIDKPEETMLVLDELKKLGVGLWLDDFGTGHSSITHLRHFPVDGLKISGDFVKGIVDEPRSRAITRHLVALAHDVGIQVIAEGIEKQQQLDLLLEWNCDYIQGFFFSRPMPLDEFERLFSRDVQ
jgi:EAL domain-containing protein (putative c-di-GMP-specific phosphodiesterase class I)